MAASIYRGIAYPFSKGTTSFPAPATDTDLIKQSLFQIVQTGRGERIMRSGFGCNANAYIFENNDALLADLMRREVMMAIGRYEPRVLVKKIDVDRDRDKGEITLTISYIILSTGQDQTAQLTISSP